MLKPQITFYIELPFFRPRCPQETTFPIHHPFYFPTSIFFEFQFSAASSKIFFPGPSINSTSTSIEIVSRPKIDPRRLERRHQDSSLPIKRRLILSYFDSSFPSLSPPGVSTAPSKMKSVFLFCRVVMLSAVGAQW